MSFRRLPLLAFLAAGLTSAATAAPVAFDEVRAIFEGKCLECHNPDKTKGKLLMTTREGFLTRPSIVRAVNDVSFTVDEGETFGLVGESGSGKTTTGRCILRLIEPTSGEVFFRGANVLDYSREQMRQARRQMRTSPGCFPMCRRPAATSNPSRGCRMPRWTPCLPCRVCWPARSILFR